MIDEGGDPALVPGLEGGQDLAQVQGEDQDPVLALVAATLDQDLGPAATHVPAPDQGPGPSLDQDLDQSLPWRTPKNQDLDRQVKKNQDLNHPWKLKMEAEKKGSVLNHALDQDQSLALSQDLGNVQDQEVDLDQKVLNKTVNILLRWHYLKCKIYKQMAICLLHIMKFEYPDILEIYTT